MASHLRATAALMGVLFAAPLATAQAAAEEPSEREFARAFVAGFFEAREIDTRCELLDPERKAKFAEYIEYLRKDTVRDYDAALITEAEDVGKRYARDPEYLDCGQAAMDRVEDRYDRIKMVVEMDKWKRDTPEGREFAEKAASAQAEVAEEMAAEEPAVEPETPRPDEAQQKQFHLGMLGMSAQIVRTEQRCKFLDEATRTRLFAVQERMAKIMRAKVGDPAAVAAAESAPDTMTGCGEDLSKKIHGLAEQIDESEAMAQALEQLDAMSSKVQRSQEAAANVDLSVPLPPPPANRPKPLTKAQKQKAEDLEHYANTLRRQRVESRCKFLPEAMHERMLRAETRYAELQRLEIADPAAVAKIDAAPDADTACGQTQRAFVDLAVETLPLTEQLIQMSEAEQAAEKSK
jgi:hypothetical protein